jgi:hypothetical protein
MPRTHARSLVMAALTAMLLTLPAAAQDAGPQVDGTTPTTAAVAPPVPTFPVYVVPYMRGGDSSATVVSITNLGDTSCATSVDWKVGVGGVACRTFLTHGGGACAPWLARGGGRDRRSAGELQDEDRGRCPHLLLHQQR